MSGMMYDSRKKPVSTTDSLPQSTALTSVRQSGNPALAARSQSGKVSSFADGLQTASTGQVLAPLSDVSAASASGPMQADKGDEEVSLTDTKEIEKQLGSGNASSELHGEDYLAMMASLRQISQVSEKSEAYEDSVSEAMKTNSYGMALAGIERYRAKLESEEGHSFKRKKQMKYLDRMIEAAKAKHFEHAVRPVKISDRNNMPQVGEGAMNEVQRMFLSKDPRMWFYKDSLYKKNRSLEADSLKSIGAYQVAPTAMGESDQKDPHRLVKREQAFSRLGKMLGSSVVLDVKAAIKDNGGRGIDSQGLLLEEAPGESYAGALSRHRWYNSALLTSQAKQEGKDPAELIAHERMLGGMDAADPVLQRELNELFLMDTLSGYRDRHGGNQRIRRDDDGIHLRAIDNDISFGTDPDDMDPSGSPNYGGLPQAMQIDRRMADRIRSINADSEMINMAFADLLSEEEIDALKGRFARLSGYIDDMDRSGMLVDQWDSGTALTDYNTGVSYLQKGGVKAGVSRNDGFTYGQRHAMLVARGANESNSTDWDKKLHMEV